MATKNPLLDKAEYGTAHDQALLNMMVLKKELESIMLADQAGWDEAKLKERLFKMAVLIHAELNKFRGSASE